MNEDQIALLRETASAAARNLGFSTDPQQSPPELWQRVLAAVETRARMGGTDLPGGWREELAEQMGRNDADAFTGPEG